MTDTAPAPIPDVAPVPDAAPLFPMSADQQDDHSGKSSFRAAMEAAGIEQGDAESARKPAGEPKPTAKAKEAEKPATTEFDPVMGIVPKKEEAKSEPEIDYSLLDKRPEGQIKHDHFSKVQAIAKAEREQRLAIEKRIAEYEAKAKEPAGLDEATKGKLSEYEKEIRERDEILEKIAYQETKKFKDNFAAPETRIIDRIKTTLKEFGADESLAEQLVAMGPRKRHDALSEVDVPEGSVAAALDSYDDLQTRKKEAIAQSREELIRWQEDQKNAEEQRYQKKVDAEKRELKEALDELAAEHELLREVPGQDEWNAGVRARRAAITEYVEECAHGNKASWKDVCKGMGYAKLAADQHDKIVVPLRAKVAELTERVSKLTAVSPGAQPQTDVKQPERKLSPEDQAKETFRREWGAVSNNGFQP